MFDKNYYLIPIFDRCILIKDSENNNVSLYDYTKQNYPNLIKLEEERIGIVYSGDIDKSLTEAQKAQISMIESKEKLLTDELGIPLFILAVGNNKKAYEIITNEPLISKIPDGLSIRKVSKSKFQKYYDIIYYSRIKKFINRRNFKLINGNNQKILKRD